MSSLEKCNGGRVSSSLRNEPRLPVDDKYWVTLRHRMVLKSVLPGEIMLWRVRVSAWHHRIIIDDIGRTMDFEFYCHFSQPWPLNRVTVDFQVSFN